MWLGIEGHDEIVERFKKALARGRLASTFLFVGPEGVGKRSFALALAKSLLCQTRDEAELNPCGECPSCLQVEAGQHPDIHVICKPDDKSSIPIALLIGEDETRMREGLCHDISLKPFMGKRRIAIIDDADYLSTPAVANCLLKTLEEPPPQSVIILIGTSASKQLPTIRSRSQIVRFKPLAKEAVARILLEKQLVADPAEAEHLAAQSGGSVTRAVKLADPELWRFRDELLTQLARPRLDSVPLAKAVNAFVDAAGKEAPPRRERARLVIGFAADFYRELVNRQAGLKNIDDAALAKHVEAAFRGGQTDSELAANRAERCLEAIGHIDRNANQSTLIEAWMDDLRTGRTMELAEA
jgi:DNA polymerase-3 subunit delta'